LSESLMKRHVRVNGMARCLPMLLRKENYEWMY